MANKIKEVVTINGEKFSKVTTEYDTPATPTPTVEYRNKDRVEAELEAAQTAFEEAKTRKEDLEEELES